MDFEESDEYKQGFENSIMEFHMRYNIRSKKNQHTTIKNAENPVKNVFDSDSKKTAKKSS